MNIKCGCQSEYDCECRVGKTAEVSKSAEFTGSVAELRLAEECGAEDFANRKKVGDNPYQEDDERFWKWMAGWVRAAGVKF